MGNMRSCLKGNEVNNLDLPEWENESMCHPLASNIE